MPIEIAINKSCSSGVWNTSGKNNHLVRFIVATLYLRFVSPACGTLLKLLPQKLGSRPYPLTECLSLHNEWAQELQHDHTKDAGSHRVAKEPAKKAYGDGLRGNDAKAV